MIPALLACLIAAGVSIQEPPANPIRWTAHQPAGPAKPGDAVSVQVTAVMDEGWHLYALEPVEGGPIPTRIAAGPAPAFTLQDSDIDRPEPKRSHDPNFGVETAYYEGSATFGLPIRIAADVQPGERDAEITARFQACNEQFCLRPQTVTMRIRIQVKK
jgi:thiol:disulfide interchange protein DsbD